MLARAAQSRLLQSTRSARRVDLAPIIHNPAKWDRHPVGHFLPDKPGRPEIEVTNRRSAAPGGVSAAPHRTVICRYNA